MTEIEDKIIDNMKKSTDDLLRDHHDAVWHIRSQKSMRIHTCEAYNLDVEHDEQIKNMNYIINVLKHYKKELKK